VNLTASGEGVGDYWWFEVVVKLWKSFLIHYLIIAHHALLLVMMPPSPCQQHQTALKRASSLNSLRGSSSCHVGGSGDRRTSAPILTIDGSGALGTGSSGSSRVTATK